MEDPEPIVAPAFRPQEEKTPNCDSSSIINLIVSPLAAGQRIQVAIYQILTYSFKLKLFFQAYYLFS